MDAESVALNEEVTWELIATIWDVVLCRVMSGLMVTDMVAWITALDTSVSKACIWAVLASQDKARSMDLGETRHTSLSWLWTPLWRPRSRPLGPQTDWRG